MYLNLYPMLSTWVNMNISHHTYLSNVIIIVINNLPNVTSILILIILFSLFPSQQTYNSGLEYTLCSCILKYNTVIFIQFSSGCTDISNTLHFALWYRYVDNIWHDWRELFNVSKALNLMVVLITDFGRTLCCYILKYKQTFVIIQFSHGFL